MPQVKKLSPRKMIMYSSGERNRKWKVNPLNIGDKKTKPERKEGEEEEGEQEGQEEERRKRDDFLENQLVEEEEESVGCGA